MKNWYIASAIIEIGAGLALLCFPSATVTLLVGAPLETPAASSVARIGGAGLLALAVACWLAREDTQSPAARGLVAALTLYNVVAAAVLVYASIGYGLHSLALWPAVVLHAGMGVWCIVCLIKYQRLKIPFLLPPFGELDKAGNRDRLVDVAETGKSPKVKWNHTCTA